MVPIWGDGGDRGKGKHGESGPDADERLRLENRRLREELDRERALAAQWRETARLVAVAAGSPWEDVVCR